MKKIFTRVLLAIVLLGFTQKTFAWGRTGHHLVAEIAFHYLDEPTKQAVKKYLGRTSIEDAATWMDDNRSNSYYDYMKPWHYVDMEKGQKFKNTAERNIVIMLNSAIKILQNKENIKESKIKEYLMIVFHLVGDIHQPLHTGYTDDKGGNTIMIQSSIYSGNLHSFWDTQILEANGISVDDCVKLYDSYSKEQIKDIETIDVLKWMYQSRSLLDEVYNFQDGKIDSNYIKRNTPVIQKQLLMAGLRLAAVLKDVFSTTHTVATPANEIAVAIPEPAPIVASHTTETKTITIEDAANHGGEVVKICTKIYGGKYLSSSKNALTFLNAGADYPNSPLTLVIWADKRANFKNAPEEFYKGKEVCVTGKIEIYKGKPEMIITKEEQIELISPK